MQHTKATRGTSGRFEATDGPKAKAVLVYLQPGILERLDAYCKLYGVGRGKAIGHLLTGALPPEEWVRDEAGSAPVPPTNNGRKAKVEVVAPKPQPEPTPPPEPKPEPESPSPTYIGREDEESGITGMENVKFAKPQTLDRPADEVGWVEQSYIRPVKPPGGSTRRRVWEPVSVVLKADGGCHSVQTGDFSSFRSPSHRGPFSAAMLPEEGMRFFLAGQYSIGETRPKGHWRFDFAININDGAPWVESLVVPQRAVQLAWDEYCRAMGRKPSIAPAAPAPPAAEPAAEQPTDSGPTNPDGSINWDHFKEPRDPNWELHCADGKELKVTGDVVRAFKARHDLPRDQRLSPEAVALFREEQEHDERRQKGRQRHLEAFLQALRERATPERLAAIKAVVATVKESPFAGNTVRLDPEHFHLDPARQFLLRGLEAVGIKPRRKLVQGVWGDLIDLRLPVIYHGGFSTAQRCLYWGTVIRLAGIDGEPPTDIGEFLSWCQYRMISDTKERAEGNVWERIEDLQTGQLTEHEARIRLGFTKETVLTRKGINDTYRALAKERHPDQGGSDAAFQRITEARDRLLKATPA
jgi:hypothetical protein